MIKANVIKAPRLQRGMRRAMRATMKKAGRDAARDMRSASVKQVRARKRLKAAAVRKATRVQRKTSGSNTASWAWGVEFDDTRIPASAYPHRQTKRGVTLSINRGRPTRVKSAFIARMASGHRGVYKRRDKARLPIDEQFGSRPIDAIRHAGEIDQVQARGLQSFDATFARVLPLEIGKQRARIMARTTA